MFICLRRDEEGEGERDGSREREREKAGEKREGLDWKKEGGD